MVQIYMLKATAQIIKILCVIVAAIFVFMIVAAQLECSQFKSIGHQCAGSDGDIWMMPFFFSLIGIPALIGSIAIFIRMLFRRKRQPQ
jgi:hypothetical protein